MKKAIILFLSLALLISCRTTSFKPVAGIDNLKREDYTVMPEATTKSEVYRFWILFIPIPIGPSSESKRDEKAYQKMIKEYHADGVLAAKYEHKHWCIPLIVLNFNYRASILTGKPYSLKIDKARNDTIK
jgi:hypothetical protein